MYGTLLRDLQQEAYALAALRGDDALPNLGPLLDAIAALTPDVAPGAFLIDLLDRAVAELDTALPAAQERRFELARRERELRERATTLERGLERLRADRRLTYAPALERLRDLLAPIVGERPPLLCELLEIPDERWQNAVEAMLGPRRFNIIVPPQRFETALEQLDRARSGGAVPRRVARPGQGAQ